jgi:hypothetical protein
VLSTAAAVTFVVGHELVGSVRKKMKFTPGAAWELRRAEWARERRSELSWVTTAAIKSRKTPLGHLAWCRTVYDLTNFANRHGVRVAAIEAFFTFAMDSIVDGVLRASERLGCYASTHFIQDDAVARVLFTARHTVEHVEYMNAWVDFGQIVDMSLDIGCPLDDRDTKKGYRVEFSHHGVECHVGEKEMKMSKDEEDKMWHDWRAGATAHMRHHVGRLASLDRMATTYSGKSLGDLLYMFAEQDCALYKDIDKVMTAYKLGYVRGGVMSGPVNQFAVQLSNAFRCDTKMLHDHVLRHSYQKMDDMHELGADCVEMCKGCSCPASLKGSAWRAYEVASSSLQALRGPRVAGVCPSLEAQLAQHEQRRRVLGVNGTVRFVGGGVVQGLADILSGYGVCNSVTPSPFNIGY